VQSDVAIYRKTAVRKFKEKEPAFVIRNGKPVAVILPIREYEILLERAGDAGDACWLGARRKKPMVFRSLEAYLTDRERGTKISGVEMSSC
jgi:hypothetical protein